ncbi:hypothetical protein Leryth_023012 [Lithospermum erythrorhizon]|nr:hypothetical protein Leryth_023012 [Lithospermum erythrorhizon]
MECFWICDLCCLSCAKQKRCAWRAGGSGDTHAPFIEDMYDKIKEMLIQYGVVVRICKPNFHAE